MSEGTKTKNDLTRIEDLGEFLHEENGDHAELESFSTDESETLDSIPDLPIDEPPEIGDDFTSSVDEIEEQDPFASDEAISIEAQTETEQFAVEDSFQTEEVDPFSGESAPVEEISQDDPFSVQESNDQPIDEQETLQEVEASPEQDSDNELIEEEQPEEEQSEAPPPIHVPPAENFQELKEFAKNISYGNVHSPGNPPFSLHLFNISHHEHETILDILTDANIIKNEERPQYLERLERDTLLIPRINEYIAIFLVHQFKNLNIEYEIGPSDLIHPPEYFEKDEDKGIISKDQMHQNKNDHLSFGNKDHQEFLITSLSTLEGWSVAQYRGPVNFQLITKLNQKDFNDLKEMGQIKFEQDFPNVYQELKKQALKLGANAIIGLQQNIATLSSNDEEHCHILFSGNATFVNRTISK